MRLLAMSTVSWQAPAKGMAQPLGTRLKDLPLPPHAFRCQLCCRLVTGVTLL